jgi:hypothetical protein
VERNWLRLLRCSGAGESLRGCESGGDGEETRRRRRVGKKVQQQLERESQPCFTLLAMAASACVASSLAVSTSSSLRSSFVRPCSFRERQYAETRFLAAGRCVAQMAMPKLAEAFQSGYGYSIFFFPLFCISCSRPSTSVFQILYDLWRSYSAAAHFVFVSSWPIFCAWREGGSLYTKLIRKLKWGGGVWLSIGSGKEIGEGILDVELER